MAVLKMLSTRPDPSPVASLTSIVFEMLESSVPTMLHVYLIVFAATGNGEHLNLFRSKFKKKELSSSAISAAVIELCRRFYQSKAEAAIMSELTWDDFECIIVHLYSEALLQMQSDQFVLKSFYKVLATQAGDLLNSISERIAVQSRQGEALYERYIFSYVNNANE